MLDEALFRWCGKGHPSIKQKALKALKSDNSHHSIKFIRRCGLLTINLGCGVLHLQWDKYELAARYKF